MQLKKVVGRPARLSQASKLKQHLDKSVYYISNFQNFHLTLPNQISYFRG